MGRQQQHGDLMAFHSEHDHMSHPHDRTKSQRHRRDLSKCIATHKQRRRLSIGCSRDDIFEVSPQCSETGDEGTEIWFFFSAVVGFLFTAYGRYFISYQKRLNFGSFLVFLLVFLVFRVRTLESFLCLGDDDDDEMKKRKGGRMKELCKKWKRNKKNDVGVEWKKERRKRDIVGAV